MATTPRVLTELLQGLLISGLVGLVAGFLSLVVWIWAVLISPSFPIWQAAQVTTIAAFLICLAFCWLDTWDTYG